MFVTSALDFFRFDPGFISVHPSITSIYVVDYVFECAMYLIWSFQLHTFEGKGKCGCGWRGVGCVCLRETGREYTCVRVHDN